MSIVIGIGLIAFFFFVAFVCLSLVNKEDKTVDKLFIDLIFSTVIAIVGAISILYLTS